MLLLLSPWLMDPASCFGQAQPYDECTGSYLECVDADADGRLSAQELPPCALEACDLNGDGNVTLGECATSQCAKCRALAQPLAIPSARRQLRMRVNGQGSFAHVGGILVCHSIDLYRSATSLARMPSAMSQEQHDTCLCIAMGTCGGDDNDLPIFETDEGRYCTYPAQNRDERSIGGAACNCGRGSRNKVFGRVNGDLRKCCMDDMRIENGSCCYVGWIVKPEGGACCDPDSSYCFVLVIRRNSLPTRVEFFESGMSETVQSLESWMASGCGGGGCDGSSG